MSRYFSPLQFSPYFANSSVRDCANVTSSPLLRPRSTLPRRGRLISHFYLRFHRTSLWPDARVHSQFASATQFGW